MNGMKFKKNNLIKIMLILHNSSISYMTFKNANDTFLASFIFIKQNVSSMIHINKKKCL